MIGPHSTSVGITIFYLWYVTPKHGNTYRAWKLLIFSRLQIIGVSPGSDFGTHLGSISDLRSSFTFIMVAISALKFVPLWASCALASVNYPPIPKDLTTPFQQRLAVYGPNGETEKQNSLFEPVDLSNYSRIRWMEHI